jgi:hypothetical protein
LSWGLKRTSAAISKMRQKHAKTTITQVFDKIIYDILQSISLSVYLSICQSIHLIYPIPIFEIETLDRFLGFAGFLRQPLKLAG